MLSWGWRLPFLASVFLLLVGWYIRAKVGESPEFQAALAQPSPGAAAARRAARSRRRCWPRWWPASRRPGSTHRDLLADLCGRHAGPRETILNGVIWGAAAAGHHSAVRLAGRPLQQAGDLHRRRAGHLAVLRRLLRAGRRRRINATSPCWWPSAWSMPPCARRSSLFASMFPPEVRYTGISLAVQIGGAIRRHRAAGRHLLAQGGGSPG